jgi:hypothetical protein
MPNPEKPQLAPHLRVYEKRGGHFRKTAEESAKEAKDIEEKKVMKEARGKVKEAVKEGQVRFGTEQEQTEESTKPEEKKPTFEEFREKEEKEFQAGAEEGRKLREAREKLEEEYREAA